MRVHDLAERGLLPDRLLRFWIRRRLREHLREQASLPDICRAAWPHALRSGPVDDVTARADAQLYELSPRFFEAVLGPRLACSAGYWPRQDTTLAESEEAMLALCCERAGLVDGMNVLDLGSGWGALALWIAEHYPACRVVAASGTKLQREWIRAVCQRRGFRSVDVCGADVSQLPLEQRFDRVLAVEVFDHVRNWEALLERIAGWLTPEGQLFAHHFCHRDYSFRYETGGAGGWLAEHFLGGGLMPSERLIHEFPRHLQVERHWRVNGTHYQRTLEAWRGRLETYAERVDAAPRESYGDGPHRVWRQRWHLLFTACAELFAWQGGEAFHVAHYRMGRSV